MSDTIRLGFIGCGNMARAHIRGCQMLAEHGVDTFVVTALCDVDADRTGEFSDVANEFQPHAAPAVYTDYRTMLAEGCVGAVDVCMPHYLHHTCCIDCMPAGVHVLVEKPLSVTVAAGWKMLEVAEETGVVLATAEQVPRWEGVRATLWAIHEAKLIGEPRLFFLQSMRGREEDPTTPITRSPITWRQNKLTGGGGPILDGGVHVCDLLIRLFGEPESIYARIDNLATEDWLDAEGNPAKSTVEDTSLATITFRGGVTGTYCISGATPGLAALR